MTQQPEALRLANELESYIGRPVCTEAAAELHRLHEVEVAYGVMMKQAESRIAEHEQALRERLEQPNDFNPDWDAMAVMVEEQQRMAKRIAELEAQPEQEPVVWRNAAIRLGEELSSVGPDGYYNMTAKQWLDWAMAQEPRGKNSLAQPEPEPKCGAIIEVFGKDWRLDYMSLPVGKHKLYTQQYNYTAPPQRKPLPPQSPCEMTQAEGKMFKLGWLECEAAHGIKENT